MTVVRSGKNEGAEGGNLPAKDLPRGGLVARLTRKLRRALLVILGIAAVALPVGFFWFVTQLPAEEIKLDRDADGIVVLTGGSSRINDAIELLASGRGRRLLISGVSPATSPGEIARLMPEGKFACCVDLDRSAVNTLGNAIGAKRWTEERDIHSLIVVTSAYHMPRAMVELAHQLPQVVLIPFPVVTEKAKAEPWWSSGSTTRLLFSEYLKYILAVVRMQIDPASPGTKPSRLSELRLGVPVRPAAPGWR